MKIQLLSITLIFCTLYTAAQNETKVPASQIPFDGMDQTWQNGSDRRDSALLQSKVLSGKEAEGIKYKDYFDFSEPIHKIPSHRILAVLRGFLEGFLRMSILPLEEDALVMIEIIYVKGMTESGDQLKKAIKDAYRRLLQPSLESEFRSALKLKADEEAIAVFAENLRQLLLSSPLGSKKILAIDPGYRTGCKVVCLDEKGELQKTDLIYIHEASRLSDGEYKIKELVKQYQIEVIAIGDGTAGRETEQFIKKILRETQENSLRLR